MSSKKRHDAGINLCYDYNRNLFITLISLRGADVFVFVDNQNQTASNFCVDGLSGPAHQLSF